MSFLLDTNVVSELRKGARADPGVRAWFDSAPAGDLYISVLTVGEIRRGIENIRRRDPAAAAALDRWLQALAAGYQGHILPVDEAIADLWGRLSAPDALPVVGGLLASTALVRGMTLVTRNTQDVVRSGVPLLNPFSAQRPAQASVA